PRRTALSSRADPARRRRNREPRKLLTMRLRLTSRCAPLTERSHHGAGIGDETKTLLHVPDRRFSAEIRRCGGAAILHQDTAIAEKIRIRQRVQHTLVSIDAGEEDRANAEIAQDAVQGCVPEAADAILVDLDILRCLPEFV